MSHVFEACLIDGKECAKKQLRKESNVTRVEQTPNWDRSQMQEMWKGIFAADRSITTVLTAHDGMANQVVQAADATWPASHARALAVTGNFGMLEARAALAQKRIIGTVDALEDEAQGGSLPVHNSPRCQEAGAYDSDTYGWWDVFKFVFELAGNMTNLSIASLRGRFGAPDITVRTPVASVSSDPEGYLSTFLLRTYITSARAVQEVALAPTQVFLRLVEMDIGSFDMSGSFHCSFWLQLSWQDMRLTWPTVEYDGVLHLPRERVWTPSVILANLATPQAFLYESPVTITHKGWMSIDFHIQGTFTCRMSSSPHPFNIHECSVRVSTSASPNDVQFLPVEMVTISGPQGFRFPEVVGWSIANNSFSETSMREEVLFTFRVVKETAFT
eukprot:943945-Amphidinium_carterae.1